MSIWVSIIKIPKIGQLISSRNLFLTVLEAEKSKIKEIADLVSGAAPFRIADC